MYLLDTDTLTHAHLGHRIVALPDIITRGQERRSVAVPVRVGSARVDDRAQPVIS